MKKISVCFLFTLLFSLSNGWGLTAFQARAIAEKMLNDQSRGKIIKMVGKSTRGTEPTSWTFISYDPFASQNGRMVTVRGDAVTNITDGYTELNRFRITAYKPDEVIPNAQLKIDSDAAVGIVKKTSDLERFKLANVSYELEKYKNGGYTAPVWKLTFSADEKNGSTPLGEARVSAENGQILQLKIDSVKP